MTGPAFQADELYQNGGKNARSILTSLIHPGGVQTIGKGIEPTPVTAPIVSVVSRDTGEQRFWVCDHTPKRACDDFIVENIAMGSTILSRTNGRVITAAMLPAPSWAIVPTNGPGMMMVMADARFTVAPPKRRERRSPPTCALSGGGHQ
jgi:hypothetical protein